MAHAHLLKLALPLIPKYGFTRTALSQSVLSSSPSSSSSTLSHSHTEPLSDTAVSALFGEGDDARRTLINAWLAEGVACIGRATNSTSFDAAVSELPPKSIPQNLRSTVSDLLHARLKYNEPVLQYLPEAFALLASPSSGIPPLDPMPALKHAFTIADEACYLSGDASLQLDWYARRAALASVYTAAELHQLASPQTAPAFLDSLLTTYNKVHTSSDEVGLFAGYVTKSWQGILRSSGIL